MFNFESNKCNIDLSQMLTQVGFLANHIALIGDLSQILNQLHHSDW